MTYFSEREEGECPREHEDICEGALGGIQALICARIKDGSAELSRNLRFLAKKIREIPVIHPGVA